MTKLVCKTRSCFKIASSVQWLRITKPDFRVCYCVFKSAIFTLLNAILAGPAEGGIQQGESKIQTLFGNPASIRLHASGGFICRRLQHSRISPSGPSSSAVSRSALPLTKAQAERRSQPKGSMPNCSWPETDGVSGRRQQMKTSMELTDP